jgi:hypothetical protein
VYTGTISNEVMKQLREVRLQRNGTCASLHASCIDFAA